MYVGCLGKEIKKSKLTVLMLEHIWITFLSYKQESKILKMNLEKISETSTTNDIEFSFKTTSSKVHQSEFLTSFFLNSFNLVPEEKFLRTIELEEKYGGKTYQAQKAKDDKKKAEKSKAAIGFVYEDSEPPPTQAKPVPDSLKTSSGPHFPDPRMSGAQNDDSDSDVDIDITVDIMALGPEYQKEINKVGKGYNLGKEDFIKYLARDIEEQQDIKDQKQHEEERSMLSVRNSSFFSFGSGT